MNFIPQLSMAVNEQRTQALSWFASVSPDCIGYDVLFSVSAPGPYMKVNGDQIPARSHPNFPLEGRQSGYYQVRSWDTQGNYSDSDPVYILIS